MELQASVDHSLVLKGGRSSDWWRLDSMLIYTQQVHSRYVEPEPQDMLFVHHLLCLVMFILYLIFSLASSKLSDTK